MKILVVGADGLIGRALLTHLAASGHEVYGTSRRPDSGCAVYLDLAQDELPVLPHVDFAVVCAAMTRFSECREKPLLAHRINVDAPARFAGHVESIGGRTLLLSTSAVFSCDEPHVRAEQTPQPRSMYGRLKAEAEKAVLAVKGGSVLRLTKVVSKDWPLIKDWIVRLSRGETIRAFSDHSFCPIELQDVVMAITAIMDAGGDGIFQISGGEDITYADAAHYLARRLGVGAGQVVAVSAMEAGLPAEDVTRYTSLDTARLTRLSGYHGAAAEEVMDRVFLRASYAGPEGAGV